MQSPLPHSIPPKDCWNLSGVGWRNLEAFFKRLLTKGQTLWLFYPTGPTFALKNIHNLQISQELMGGTPGW